MHAEGIYIYKQPDCEKFAKGEGEGGEPNILLYTKTLS